MSSGLTYPGTALALRLAEGDRARARQLMREAILERAEEQIHCAGKSLKCIREAHAQEPGGCLNDGTLCICACHDPDQP